MLSLIRFAYGDNLSNFGLLNFMVKMTHIELLKLIEREDINGLQGKECEIADCIEYEMRGKSETYLIQHIAKCPNHTNGRIMFQTLKHACSKKSPYHWYEIMHVIGKPMMVGAAMSQNIKLLEHAMAHVDEIELERLLYDYNLPEVEKWYDENFVVT